MIIADTGFWIALANADDKHHQLAIDAFSKLREPLITTWPVVTETCHLLLKRMGIEAELGFMRTLHQGCFIVFDIRNEHRGYLLRLMEKYADLPMDLADASLVVLAEELHDGGYSALISATSELIAGRTPIRFRICCFSIE